MAVINGKAPSSGVGGVTDADLMNLAVNFLSPGVVGANDLLVQQQGTPNMTVLIATGKVYVLNGAGSMMYLGTLNATQNVTIASNSSGNPRIDAIVVKIDTSTTPDNTASNIATLVAVQGTPAASPSAPSDSAIQTAVGAGNAFYRLANVTVANGAVSITTANIASTRSQATLSGGFTSGFSVTMSANQTINGSTSTKVLFDTEDYDLGSEFASNKFTATKAGKYLFCFGAYINAIADAKTMILQIYKNGSRAKQATYQTANAADIDPNMSVILSLAAGDYVEFYVYHNDSSSRTLNAGAGHEPETYAMGQRLA